MRTPDRKGRDHRLGEAMKALLNVTARLGGSAPSPKNLRVCAGELRSTANSLESLAEENEV